MKKEMEVVEIRTEPACRVGWQGRTLHYVVTAEGATEVAVGDHGMEGVEVRIEEQRQTESGVEADVYVDVTGKEVY